MRRKRQRWRSEGHHEITSRRARRRAHGGNIDEEAPSRDTHGETRPRWRRPADGRRSLQRRPRCALAMREGKRRRRWRMTRRLRLHQRMDQKQPVAVWHTGTTQGGGCGLHAPTHKRPAKASCHFHGVDEMLGGNDVETRTNKP
ncbi:uncharacterized protein LOC119358882 [Triticum dicoccoides]|uniref:uncharacterized protein LOC119358882 n=1 Tax=Triticum dicoccoides TaxID=85692 RepID=UPI00188F0C9E|nr:uncharacterized protein LOC119358882 [Triticum dicoccoides]